MKKLSTLLIIPLLMCLSKNSSAQAFTAGSNSIYAGYGFVTLLGSISNSFDVYNDTKTSQLGPIYVKYERGVSDHIGMGLNFGYVKNQWKYSYDSVDSLGNAVIYTETDARSSWSLLARMNYHIGESDKIDPYVGFGLGYRSAHWSHETTNPYGTNDLDFNISIPFGFEATFGLRYFVTPNIAAYAEVGMTKSIFQVGVSLNIPGS